MVIGQEDSGEGCEEIFNKDLRCDCNWIVNKVQSESSNKVLFHLCVLELVRMVYEMNAELSSIVIVFKIFKISIAHREAKRGVKLGHLDAQ